MEKKQLLIIVIAAVCLLQACKGGNASTSADSMATANDTSKVLSIEHDSSGTPAADTAFAAKAAISGMAEVALGKLAAAKAAGTKVKEFGNMMVMDHSKANGELMNIAKSKNFPLPGDLDTEHQAKSDSLSKLDGEQFDRAYVRVMVEGHQNTLALMQSEANGGKDAALKAFAAKTAPVVQMHLAEITKIQKGLK